MVWSLGSDSSQQGKQGQFPANPPNNTDNSLPKVETQKPPPDKPITPPTTKPFVAIGVPHMETVTMQWALYTLGPLAFLPVDWCIKLPLMARGVPQNLARDQIVEMMLADKRFTHILWVDSDNVPEEPDNVNEALKALYNLNLPMVSGLYRAKQASGFHYAAWMDANLGKPGYFAVKEYTGNLFQVDTVGMGFCLIRREIYEVVPPPWHPWPKISPSEDFNFCVKAKSYGFPMWVYGGVKLGHIGTLNVHPDGSITTLKA